MSESDIVDAVMKAEAGYARTRRPDGRGWGMPPRDQVERLVTAAIDAYRQRNVVVPHGEDADGC